MLTYLEISQLQCDIVTLRQNLIGFIANACYGDVLVAEYVLLNLISRVYAFYFHLTYSW